MDSNAKNAWLKKPSAEQMLENDVLKDVLGTRAS